MHTLIVRVQFKSMLCYKQYKENLKKIKKDESDKTNEEFSEKENDISPSSSSIKRKRMRCDSPDAIPMTYSATKTKDPSKKFTMKLFHLSASYFVRNFGEDSDEEDEPPSQSRLNWGSIFYTLNTNVLESEGRMKFMRQFGIIPGDNETIEIYCSVPITKDGWIKVLPTPGSTDPFDNYAYTYTPFSQILSVIRFMSGFNTPNDKEYVPVREITGIEVNMDNQMEVMTEENPTGIYQEGRDYITGGVNNYARDYMLRSFIKTYMASIIPDEDGLYELIDTYVNPNQYTDQADFEKMLLRPDNHVIYNSIKEAEPANTSYTYEDADSAVQDLGIVGVAKIMDLQFSKTIKTSTRSIVEGTDQSWQFYNRVPTDTVQTDKLRQGEMLAVDFTSSGDKPGMFLFQNVGIILSNLFIAPGVKPLDARGQVNYKDPNYKNLETNWVGLQKPVSDPRYFMKLFVSQNSIPFDSYKYLTGISPSTQVTYENAEQNAITTFGTIGAGSSQVFTVGLNAKNEMERTPLQVRSNSYRLGTLDINHAHIKHLPFQIMATDQGPPKGGLEKLPKHFEEGMLLSNYIHNTMYKFAKDEDQAKDTRINTAARLCKWLKDHNVVPHADFITVEHIMKEESFSDLIKHTVDLCDKKQSLELLKKMERDLVLERKHLLDKIELIEIARKSK